MLVFILALFALVCNLHFMLTLDAIYRQDRTPEKSEIVGLAAWSLSFVSFVVLLAFCIH